MTRSFTTAALLGLLACTGTDDTSEVPVTAAVQRTYEAGTSGSDGLYTVIVPVNGAASRFMVTGWTDLWVSLEEVRDPRGNTVVYWEDWISSDESLTYAFYEQHVNAVNWPIREEDGVLSAGDWEIVLATTRRGEYESADLEVAVHTVVDPSLLAARVKVRIAYAQGVDQSDHVVQSVETAVERWREIWAARGITLVETYESTTLDDDLPWAYQGGSAIQQVAARGQGDELLLVIGETMPDGTDTLGVSGGLPGSLEATDQKFVALSWLAHAGTNALFDDEERRIMGETMAHELGHFMGLFHPVEDSFDTWDALRDTVNCRAESACDSALGSNNMYPYPLCDWESCGPQGDVTDDQQGVLHRHVGAL